MATGSFLKSAFAQVETEKFTLSADRVGIFWNISSTCKIISLELEINDRIEDTYKSSPLHDKGSQKYGRIAES